MRLRLAFTASCFALTLAGCLQTETYRLRTEDWQAALLRSPVEREQIAVPAERAADGKPVFVRAPLLPAANVLAAGDGQVTLRVSDYDVLNPLGGALVAFNVIGMLAGALIIVIDQTSSHGENVPEGVTTYVLGTPVLVISAAATIVGAVLLGIAPNSDRDHGVLEVPVNARGWNYLPRRATRARGLASIRWNGGLGFRF